MNPEIIIAMVYILIAFPENVVSEFKGYFFPLIKQFDIKHPTIIEYSRESCVKMAKKFSKNDISIVTNNNFINNIKKVVISEVNYSNLEVISKMRKSIQKGLLTFDDKSLLEKTVSKLTFEINQEVYFFDKSSFELFEVYDINSIKTIRKLGYLNKEFNNFFWDENVQQRSVNKCFSFTVIK